MKIVVKKFGGTSVGDIERIRNVARLVEGFQKRHPDTRVAVVVSAMAGETNRLIELAKSCVKDPSPRELDVLLATGEQVSTALLSMALLERGVQAQSLSATQARIETDKRFTNAQIQDIDGPRIRALIESGIVPVIAGFQGVDPDGNITTLGRGGSDITAVALAASLKAEACFIYTDVEGVYSTDPRICAKARPLRRVCHEEMLEMASLGAKVLHPRSVYFAMRYEVPLVVMSTFNPGQGTWIVKEEELMEQPFVTGITYRMDETKITIHGLPGGIQAVEKIFTSLGNAEIFIDMITQTGLENGKTNISFTVPTELGSKTMSVLDEWLGPLGAEGAKVDNEIAKVSVVGIGMRYHTGVAAKMFEALASESIDVQMISTSEIKISVIIPRKYCEVAVRTLHDAFVEDKVEVSLEA